MAVSAQRRRRVLVAVVFALIAAGVFVLALSYMGKPGSSTPGSGAATPPPVSTTTVVVASKDIAQGNAITAADLTTTSWPTATLKILTQGGASYYTSVAALTQAKEYAAVPIVAQSVILSTSVTTSAAAAATPVPGLPSVLPAGYVAVAMPYSPDASSGTGEGTGGYIQPLDRVDIVVYMSGNLYWAYQDALVLAVSSSTGAPAESSAGASSSAAAAAATALVMLELPRQDAAALVTANDTAGSLIQYLIVSSADYPSPSASPVPSINAAPTTVPGAGPNTYFGG